MRSWRNWQTRTVQVRVGDHGGSNPFDRTIMKETSFWVSLLLCIQSGRLEPVLIKIKIFFKKTKTILAKVPQK